MNVALFYLPDVKYGGWPTYTAHLYHGLLDAGYKPMLFKIGNRTEPNTRAWGRKIRYKNLSLQDAANIALMMPTIITATNMKYEKETELLVNAGAKVVIHDPTELKGSIVEILKDCKDVITIRPINVINLEKKDIESRYVPHPYKRYAGRFYNKSKWAASFSRIDWDKGTHHIVSANEKLEKNKQIDIYGAPNRLYTFHKLPSGWEEKYYKGTFTADSLWEGAKIASKYEWAVDMSTISGDGGGTQYTFLEAIDAKAGLLLNSGWITGRNDDELLENATFVKPEELHMALESKPNIYGTSILEKHNAATIAKKTLGKING
jgi:hypothetical protein